MALRMHLAPRIALHLRLLKILTKKALRSRAVISVLWRDRETDLQRPKGSGEYLVSMNTRRFDMDSERCEIRWF